jgi:predicted CXXCH cytochrome family protein
MPHPEHVAVNWPINGRANLANGQVTCSSCHTPGFRHRGDAFLARDQKGLCSPCHYGQHVLPNAHPFGTPCSSCHTAPKASLVAASPACTKMVDSIDGECLRCHYDGPISHPIGMPNSKKAAPDLPLGRDGKITCVTCHYGHSNQNPFGQLLRKNNRRGGLCLSCHDDL